LLHALIVEDEPSFLEALSEIVRREGFEVTAAPTLAEARTRLAEARPDVLLLDLHLPDGPGLDLLASSETDNLTATTDIVLITGLASVETAVEALRRGVADYLSKPIEVPRLKAILANVARTRTLRAEIGTLRGELRRLGRFGSLIGASSAMQGVYDAMGRVAPTDATVFVIGETGTGKEVVARTIHEMSRRAKRPFVPVNSAAISPQLIESELFGHERGSFTGADRMRRGVFEQSDGGTLFLDEITEMDIDLQSKLLRALESRKVQRVGSAELIPIDVRVIAATNLDPREAVSSGKLREDLYYRLNVFPIALPPLRDRPGDVERLADHFLSEIEAEDGIVRHFTPDALDRLRRHSWPGNVRELRNVVQRSAILGGEKIGPEALPLRENASSPLPSHAPAQPGRNGDPTVSIPPGMPLAQVEKRHIETTLAHFEGDKKRAAEALGMSLKTLYVRLRAYRGV
jgi:two-component system response regulator AtoC